MSTNEASFAHCRRVARARARNFYYSFALLPPAERDAMCAIYACMRRSDDIADDATEPVQVRREQLADWRGQLVEAMQDRRYQDQVLPAFSETVQRYEIPQEYFLELIAGMESDLCEPLYGTFDDLYRYCYRAAAVVGMATIHVFGFETPNALPLAEKCGIAFQLTNIMRDIQEDARLGRVYFPESELRDFGMSRSDLLDNAVGQSEERFQSFMEFQWNRGREVLRASLPAGLDDQVPEPPCPLGDGRNLSRAAGTHPSLRIQRARAANRSGRFEQAMDSRKGHASAIRWGDPVIPKIKIVGGGLAGLAAAVRLGEAGHAVEVHEARPFLGGRAASYPLHPSDPNSVRIDNCQHVLLRCCNALMDFYERCGVQDKIAFHDTLYLVQPGGRTDRIRADAMPAPLHLAGSLLLMRSLDWRDKASLLRCLATVKRDRNRADIENITFTRWLQEKRATARSIDSILASVCGQRLERGTGCDVRSRGIASLRRRTPRKSNRIRGRHSLRAAGRTLFACA